MRRIYKPNQESVRPISINIFQPQFNRKIDHISSATGLFLGQVWQGLREGLNKVR